MKDFLKRTLALILSLSLLAGCSGNAGSSSPSGEVALGRYLETELPLPENLVQLLAFEQSRDGTLNLVGYFGKINGRAWLRWYCSSDTGKSWSEKTVPLFSEQDESDRYYSVSAAAFDAEGRLYLNYDSYPPLAGQQEGEYRRVIGYLSEDGGFTELPYEQPAAQSGAGVRKMLIAPNGTLILDCYFDVIQIDLETGKNETTLVSGDKFIDDVALWENSVLISYSDRIEFYDLDSAEKTGEQIPEARNSGDSASGRYRTLLTGADGAVYFADAAGLYRFVPGNSMLEKLLDGGLCSLGAPYYGPMAMAVPGDGSLLVLLGSEDGFQLLSYHYEPEAPTLPETELKIYSIEDNRTIRQAISLFQRQNPSVYVTYRTSREEENLSDALRVLSTELLAGKGPDVLLLDGLPVKSYEEKGVLLDLTEFVQEKVDAGELLHSPANAYRMQDGKLFAVPARFVVPMMQADADAVDQINSVTDLADWLEEHRDSFSRPLNCTYPQRMLEEFFPVSLHSMVNEDGTFERDALSDFLSGIKRIYDLDPAIPRDRQTVEDYHSFQFDALSWMEYGIGVNLGRVVEFGATFAPYVAMEKREGGAVATLFHQNVLIPWAGLGVNAASNQKELALSFVDFVLSDEVQRYHFSDGLPVSAKVFEEDCTPPQNEDDRRYSFYGAGYFDAAGEWNGITMNVVWPPDEIAAQTAALLSGTDVPVDVDLTTLDIIVDESAAYFAGDRQLEETVTSILQKLNLRSME